MLRHCAIALVFLLVPLPLAAHSGGTDALGCHTQRRTGDYHCHSGREDLANRFGPHAVNEQTKSTQAPFICSSDAFVDPSDASYAYCVIQGVGFGVARNGVQVGVAAHGTPAYAAIKAAESAVLASVVPRDNPQAVQSEQAEAPSLQHGAHLRGLAYYIALALPVPLSILAASIYRKWLRERDPSQSMFGNVCFALFAVAPMGLVMLTFVTGGAIWLLPLAVVILLTLAHGGDASGWFFFDVLLSAAAFSFAGGYLFVEYDSTRHLSDARRQREARSLPRRAEQTEDLRGLLDVLDV